MLCTAYNHNLSNLPFKNTWVNCIFALPPPPPPKKKHVTCGDHRMKKCLFPGKQAQFEIPNLNCVYMYKNAKFPPKFQNFPPHINISREWASQIPHFFSPWWRLLNHPSLSKPWKCFLKQPWHVAIDSSLANKRSWVQSLDPIAAWQVHFFFHPPILFFFFFQFYILKLGMIMCVSLLP